MVILRFILKSKTLGEIGLAVSRHIFLDSFEDMCPIITFKINFTCCFYRNSTFLHEAGSGGTTRKLGRRIPP